MKLNLLFVVLNIVDLDVFLVLLENLRLEKEIKVATGSTLSFFCNKVNKAF